MTPLPVSVIVVSRGRPMLLSRCLTGLSQLWYPAFEVIVVADPAGCSAVAGLGDTIKITPFDLPNISAARNAGLARAAGHIIAFIDDDAVPEPTWLDRLTAPFADPDVVQTGGYVRGRNGISFQWQGRVVDHTGSARNVTHPDDRPFTPETKPGEAVKTEGTNMALRRDVITALGGFDPALRFYLDETDVNLRLAPRRTVLVPLAQVHHGYGASDHRAADRRARDLTQIGASSAVFWRKHLDPARWDTAKAELRNAQFKRLSGQIVTAGLDPRDVARLMQTLDTGFQEGFKRDIAPLAPVGVASEPFLPLRRPANRDAQFIAGRVWQRGSLAEQAQQAVAEGTVTTVLRLSPTALPHRTRFHPDGYWEQRGGLFGPSDRSQSWFRPWRFASRVQAEKSRVASLREYWANRPNDE